LFFALYFAAFEVSQRMGDGALVKLFVEPPDVPDHPDHSSQISAPDHSSQISAGRQAV
jgi:hypothetical protein